jgi:hypothetical protein
MGTAAMNDAMVPQSVTKQRMCYGKLEQNSVYYNLFYDYNAVT